MSSSKETIRADNPEAYGAEVLKCIGQMREQNYRLCNEISTLDVEKKKLQNDIRYLTDRLAKLNYHLAQKTQFKCDLSKTIKETEEAYRKLIESSQVLYQSVKDTKNQILDPEKTGTSSDLLQQIAVETRNIAPMTIDCHGFNEARGSGTGTTTAAAVAAEMYNNKK